MLNMNYIYSQSSGNKPLNDVHQFLGVWLTLVGSTKMFSYVKVLCVTTITKNIPKKKFKERDLFFVSIQIVSVKGLMNLTLSGNYRTIEILDSSPCVTND